MGNSQIIRGNNGATTVNDGFDIAKGIDNSVNGPDGCCSADGSDGDNSPEGYQIAKKKSPA